MPLAVAFAEAGFRVTGLDIDGAKLAALQRGESYIEDIAAERVQRLIGGKLATSTDFDATLAVADVAIICVPTPLNKTRDPDIRALTAASQAIAANMARCSSSVASNQVGASRRRTTSVCPGLTGLRSRIANASAFAATWSPSASGKKRDVISPARVPAVNGHGAPSCPGSARVLG